MIAIVKRSIRQFVRRRGYDIVDWRPSDTASRPKHKYDQDVTDAEAEIIDAVAPYAMTGPYRTLAMIRATRYVAVHGIDGAITECGVWRGGSMMAAAMVLQECGADDRQLFLYDTFEGMTAPSGVDVHIRGVVARDRFQEKRTGADRADWCVATLAEVKASMSKTGYDNALVRYVKGKVEDTIPNVVPDQIAPLRLDTDWYESTRHELIHLYPRLVVGGALIIDDYFGWQGQRKAVDEWLAKHRPRLYLHRIDRSARIAIKQSE